MPIFINGKKYRGNVSIVNGRVISGDSCDDLSSQKFDEVRKVPASGVNRIIIESDINVKVSACNTNDVVAHLYGSAITDNSPQFSVSTFGEEIRISVKSEEGSMSIICGSSISIGNINIVGINGLVLDVQIPERDFQRLTIESKNGNIDVTNLVDASTITANSKNGNINIDAMFRTLYIDCKNGNIEVTSEAHGDIDLDITSKNGNIDVTLENIGTSKVSVDSKNGNCRNTPRLRGVFTASGSITSWNGNVKIR